MTCLHCAALEERVAWLESELGLQVRAEISSRLRNAILGIASGNRGGRAQTADLVAALYAAKGRPMTIWQIMEAIPSPSGNDDRDPRLAAVLVCIARKWLGHDGIRTVWGAGYALTEVGMEKVQSLIGPVTTEAVAA